MNNKSIALNILHTHADMLQKISYVYKSRFNKTKEK